MKERKETINIVTANLWGLLLLAIAAIVGFAYFWLVSRALHNDPLASLRFNGGVMEWWMPLAWMLLCLVVMILGAALHEFVHGLTWARYCKNGWRSISFGIMWKMITPYCHCSEPLSVPQYRTGALMPLYVVGILPVLVSPLIPSIGMCCFGVLFTSGAIGDLMVVWRLRKENPKNMILDHPTEAGYLVYEEDEEEK